MNAIFAVDAFGGFGTGDDMPWPTCREDLQRFKRLTSGHTVVMGSGTWNSNMPKPLPHRRNTVLSTKLVDNRCEVYNTVEALLEAIGHSDNVWVIGGESVLWTLRQYVDTIYLTRFRGVYQSSIRMDVSEYLAGFKLHSRQELEDHIFDIWQRVV